MAIIIAVSSKALQYSESFVSMRTISLTTVHTYTVDWIESYDATQSCKQWRRYCHGTWGVNALVRWQPFNQAQS